MVEAAIEGKQVCENILTFGVSMSKTFSRFSFLTVMNVSYRNLENQGTIALVNALKNSAPSLIVIELAGNNITDEAAPDMAASLALKLHLKKLNLSENYLKDEGCVEIVKSMEYLELLEHVDMSYNGLRDEGAIGLANVVVKKEGFKMLNIDGNMISSKGIEEVKEIFKNFPKLLGPLDDNDPYGEENEYDDYDYDDDDSEIEDNVYEDEFEDEFVSVFIFY